MRRGWFNFGRLICGLALLASGAGAVQPRAESPAYEPAASPPAQKRRARAGARRVPKPPITKIGLLDALRLRQLTTREMVEEVERRGVDFRLTDDIEKGLRAMGALDPLVEAVRSNYEATPLRYDGLYVIPQSQAHNESGPIPDSYWSPVFLRFYPDGTAVMITGPYGTDELPGDATPEEVAEYAHKGVKTEIGEAVRYTINSDSSEIVITTAVTTLRGEFSQSALELSWVVGDRRGAGEFKFVKVKFPR